MKLAGFGVWLLLLGAGEVCGVILGEWRGEDPADSDIPGEDEKQGLSGEHIGFRGKKILKIKCTHSSGRNINFKYKEKNLVLF